MRILVIEDEAGIADFLQRGLAADGYSVTWESDGERGLEAALTGDFSLVLLDRMLPGRDGIEVLAEVRAAKPDLPVIMLTARGAVADRVDGLDTGAIDYITKPFAFDELSARIRTHLRGTAQPKATRLSALGLEVDLLTRRVRRDGEPVLLSTREFALLTYLMRHAGQVRTREQILAAVWGYSHDPATNIVEVYIGYLRRKLGRKDDPAPIVTVRSVGYKLARARA